MGAAQLGVGGPEAREVGPDGPAPGRVDRGRIQAGAGTGIVLGSYELLEKIAEGGMGVVYKARQINLDRLVAVKLLPFSQFTRADAVKRFRAEAAAAASLQHPNIVAIHDVEEHEGQLYYSMDFVSGRTLAELVRDQPLSSRRAASYLKTIAEAVHYAHEHGIVHRDLKPSNILIDESDQPRISDFGLAKRLVPSFEPGAPDGTLTGQVLGSPNYISPEQAAGSSRTVGPASDVYSLGALLYDLLTKQPPFQAENLSTLLKQVIETEPVPPRVINPDISRELEIVCLKCLEKEIARRYATAKELGEDLGRYLEGKPIHARPVGSVVKAWKAFRRRPAIVGLGVALGLSLMLGLGGVLSQWQRTRQMAQAERRQRGFAEANQYAGDMRLAQLALADNNRALAAGLLDKYRLRARSTREVNLRGWEWRYLWQLLQGDEIFTLHRYPVPILGMALSPDGQLLALTTGKELGLWDPHARRPVGGWTGITTKALAFVPGTNIVAFGLRDQSGQSAVGFWNPNENKLTLTLPYGADVRSLSFSSDGRLLATFNVRGGVQVVDWKSAQVITNLPQVPPRYTEAGAVAFSPNGSNLAIGQDMAPTHLLDLRTGVMRSLSTEVGLAAVISLAFSQTGELLAAGHGYNQGTIGLWDPRSGRVRGRLTNHTDEVRAFAFSSDGLRMATASLDGTIRLWSTSNFTELRSLRSSREGLTTLVMLPDGRLVCGGAGGSVCLWDTTYTNSVLVHTQTVISSPLGSFASLDHSKFMAGNLDPRVVRRSGYAFTPDSSHFIHVDTNGSLCLWNAQSLRPERALPEFGSNHWGLTLSSDGRYLATGNASGTGSLTIWDWTTHRAVTNFALPFEWFGLLRFSPSGRFFIAVAFLNDVSMGSHIELWRTSDWSSVPLPGSEFAGVWSVGISPDDRWLAAGYADGAVRLFRFPSGQYETGITNHFGPVDGVAFFGTGNVVVSTGLDGYVRLWDTAERRELADLQGHPGFIMGSALSRDGKRFASGGQSPGDAVKLWDLVAQREILSLQAEGKYFYDVHFSPDGNTLTATPFIGAAHLWRAPSLEEIDDFEMERGIR